MSDFLKAVAEHVVIYDGAMGTSVQARNLSADEFWGKEGYDDILVLSRPDVVKERPAPSPAAVVDGLRPLLQQKGQNPRSALSCGQASTIPLLFRSRRLLL